MSEFVEPDRYVLIGFHEILMRRTIKNSCEHLFNQLMLQRVMISSGGGDNKVTKISTKASVFKSTTRVHAHSWPFGYTECSWLKSMFWTVQYIPTYVLYSRDPFTHEWSNSSQLFLIVLRVISYSLERVRRIHHKYINEWMDEYRSINQ